MGEMMIIYNILVGKTERKRPPGRHRRTGEYNIRMDIWEIGRDGVDWIHLFQDGYFWRALVNTVMKFRVP
jgi:hypothetical protein